MLEVCRDGLAPELAARFAAAADTIREVDASIRGRDAAELLASSRR